jgi:hypothetical protein
VPTTTNPQSVHQARIAAVVVLITASFSALWDLLGAAALPGTPSSVAAS